MAYAYKPAFVTKRGEAPVFQTNGAFSVDRYSKPVVIDDLKYDDNIRTIIVRCSDGKTRSCRIDRFSQESFIEALSKALQELFDKGNPVEFIAAGGDPNVWFYDVQEAA